MKAPRTEMSSSAIVQLSSICRGCRSGFDNHLTGACSRQQQLLSPCANGRHCSERCANFTHAFSPKLPSLTSASKN